MIPENVYPILEAIDSEGANSVLDLFLAKDKRNILLNDNIDESIIESVYIPLRFYEEDSSNEPVTLYINSRGGDFFTSFFLADVIENYKKPLKIIGLGCCYSAAFYLLTAGKNNPNVKRLAYDKTTGLIHAGSYNLEKDVPKLLDVINLENKMQGKIEEFFLRNSNLTAEEYKSHYKDDWYMTAKEMLDKGLIDEIIK